MSQVQVILRADVDGVGKRGDIVAVSKGYARNFLEPHGLAIPATAGAAAQATAMRRARDLKDVRDRESAETLAKAVSAKPVTVAVRAGEGGKLFGSVGISEITSAVASDSGISLERKWVLLEEPIKELGTHQVTVRPHEDVEFTLTVEVAEA
ncbi:MAG: 50S ribosomal protein L9 [Actinomycetes bacterium]